MKQNARALLRRMARSAAGCLLGGAMMVPLGLSTTSQAVSQINAMSMRPLPSVPRREVVREPLVWVPDRVVPLPFQGTVAVPGHWERPLEGRDVYVPPLTVRNPDTGVVTTLPAGIQPPATERLAP